MNFPKSKIAAVLTLLAGIALNTASASAHGTEASVALALGNAAQAGYATHTVAIDAGTKSVNVNQNDVVTFNLAGKSFTWQFGTFRAGTSFNLADIAPESFDSHGVRVYVAPDPLYRN
jgi:3-oxoacyl-[acyl-carrier-protein] synthase III